MKPCPHRGKKCSRTTTEDGTLIIVYACTLETNCTLDYELISPAGCPIAVCANCTRQNEPVKARADSWQWGDAVDSALTRIGITKSRVATWLGNCGCAERQRKLNALGQWAHDLVAGSSTPEQLDELLGK